MQTLQEKERQEILDKMDRLLSRAESANRGLSPLEDKEYKGLEFELREADREIRKEKEIAQARAEGRFTPFDGPTTSMQDSELSKTFVQYLTRGGRHALNPVEQRALQMDLADSGGYATVPQEMVKQILKKIDNLLFISDRATIYDVTSASLGVPTLETDASDPDWTAEILTGTTDSVMGFGKRELFPHPLAKSIRVSNKLLRSAVGNIADFVMSRLAYKIGVALEKTYLTGTGANQPLGLFTASALGIDVSRDVSTGNTITGITADGLIEAQGALKSQYRRNAVWLFSRTAITKIRKLKDGDGQYLWAPSLAGTPETVLGSPVLMSEYVPAVFTTGQYIGLYGDLSYFWVARALKMQIQVVDQLYAASNQTAYFARCEVDAMPVNSEAFVRVTLA